MKPTKPTNPFAAKEALASASSGPAENDNETQYPSAELIEEMSRLESLIGILCHNLNQQDQHRFAADCAQRSLPLFENQFPDYPQPGEALRLRRLLAEQQISEHAWLVATNQVINTLESLFPVLVNPPQTLHDEDDLPPACFAACATIVDPGNAALYSDTALLAATQDSTSHETEIRWQWQRCLHYFRHGIPPEVMETGAAAPLTKLMPNTRSLSCPLPAGLPSQNEQLELLYSVLSEREQHLFIADCAERVLHVFEEAFPNDKRPREAVRLRRLFAEEKISTHQWHTARDAAFLAADKATPRRGTRLLSPKDWTQAQSAVMAAASINLLETSDLIKAARLAASAMRSYSNDPNALIAERDWQVARLLRYLKEEATPSNTSK